MKRAQANALGLKLKPRPQVFPNKQRDRGTPRLIVACMIARGSG